MFLCLVGQKGDQSIPKWNSFLEILLPRMVNLKIQVLPWNDAIGGQDDYVSIKPDKCGTKFWALVDHNANNVYLEACEWDYGVNP